MYVHVRCAPSSALCLPSGLYWFVSFSFLVAEEKD